MLVSTSTLGYTTTTNWDAAGRIDGTMVTNTWDAAGQQLTSQDVTGVTSLLWDLNGRQIATQNPTGINLTNTPDPLGNRLVLADPWGVTSYAWDAQSRLTGILNLLNEQTTIQWDPLTRESHRVLANGMAFEVVVASCSLNHARVLCACRCGARDKCERAQHDLGCQRQGNAAAESQRPAANCCVVR